jgi:hypothetical protein
MHNKNWIRIQLRNKGRKSHAALSVAQSLYLNLKSKTGMKNEEENNGYVVFK